MPGVMPMQFNSLLKNFHTVSQLSSSQQQRASISRATMQGGNILLAEEHVFSLDEQQRLAYFEYESISEFLLESSASITG